MSTDRIEIVCSGPGHARGKVAKIDTLHRIEGGQWVSSTAPKSSVVEHRRPDDPDTGVWGSDRYRRAGSDHGANRIRYGCKLCRTVLECTEPVLLWTLDSVATQNISRIELRVLILIASQRGRR